VVNEPDVRMAYGRLSIARDNFLGDGFLVSYRKTAAQGARLPPAERSTAYTALKEADKALADLRKAAELWPKRW
jgi:hypothetical protein